MKALPSSKADNLLTLPEGKARFYPKIKSKGRWKNPDVPEYEPNWLVRFNVLGKSWLETADGIPVAMGLKPVKAWAKERILTEAALIMQGKLDKLRALREPSKAVMLDELLKVYNGHVQGQDERLRDGLRLAAIWTETLGLPTSQIPVTDAVWCPANIESWMRMRQEHYRRGWTATRKPPVDAWDQLRRELAAGTLRGIDMSTPMACNTTIRNYLKAGRTVFAHGRRFVRGLELPELRDFMTYKHGLTLPSGHREISQEVVDAIWEELPNLRLRCERAWLLFQILAHSAARPVTIKRMTVEDVTWSADGWCTLSLPATKGGDAVDVTLPPEIASPLKQHATREGLLGGYLDRVHYKTLNPWLRRRGVEDEHAAYLLRHRRLQQERDHAGVAAAAGLGGHKDEKMVRSIYTRGQRVQAAAIDPRTGEVILRAGEKPVKVRVTRPMHRQG
jgi:integrase